MTFPWFLEHRLVSVLDVLFASWWKCPLLLLIVQLHGIVLVSHKTLTRGASLRNVENDDCTCLNLYCLNRNNECSGAIKNKLKGGFELTHIFSRCGRWSRWLAGLWRGPVAVFGYADEDVWETGEGRTLRAQQPCGSPDDQLLWAAAEQSATTGWVHPLETQELCVCGEF